MGIKFLHPSALILLLALPWVYYLTRRSYADLGKFREIVALLLRVLIVILLVLALAGMQRVKRSDKLSVLFALDLSDSIPETYKEKALSYINQACKKMKANDSAGLVVFGSDSSIEASPREKLKVKKVYSIISPKYTDIAQAIRLALAAFPGDSQKRIVLISDGNENKGDCVKEALIARSNQAQIDVLPIDYRYEKEVIVEKLIIPSEVKKGEAFEVRIIVNSFQDARGILRLFEDGRLVGEEEVILTPGKNPFLLTHVLDKPGFYTYESHLESPSDTLSPNNKATGFTLVRGKPKVLYIEAEPGQGSHLSSALSNQKVDVEVHGLEGIPSNLAELQNYDSLILSNVPAGALSKEQMQMIESNVKDLGIGLIMVGGEDSFGAGGYLGTPIERALPVSMDISSKKVLPSGALVLILHTCEIPNGNAWAREISLATIDVLTPTDKVGFLYYSGGERWLFPIQEARDKKKLGGLIAGMMPGDMPNFDPSLRMAHQGLNKTKAHLKHVVILSDGDPSRPSPSLVQQMVNDKITISTILIGPHSPDAFPLMQGLAALGRGNFYNVTSPSSLPQIFIKEAAIVLKSSILEEPFTPLIVAPTEIIRGIEEELPTLFGYVATSSKPLSDTPIVSHNNDPVLSHWRYGLGKSVAFTSDAKPRWAKEWIPWEKFSKFWSQVVRWTVRTISKTNFQTMVDISERKGQITIDAIDESGDYINFLDLHGNVVSPVMKTQSLRLRQTAPGRYEGEFGAEDVGAYMINISHMDEEGRQASQTTGTAVSYSPEYRDLKTNYRLLSKLVKESEGRLLTEDDNIFTHDRPGVTIPQDIWMKLLILVVFLFPLDVAIRRLQIEYGQVQAFFLLIYNKVWPKAKLRRLPIPAEVRITRLLERKAKMKHLRRKVIEEPVPSEQEEAKPLVPDVEFPREEEKEEERIEEPKPASFTERLLEAKKRAKEKREKEKD